MTTRTRRTSPGTLAVSLTMSALAVLTGGCGGSNEETARVPLEEVDVNAKALVETPSKGTNPPPANAASATQATQGRATQPQQPPPGTPPLVASPASINFGIVEPGSKLSTDVTLLNTSSRPVRILKAQPSCTCTTVDMTNVIIPPRATVQMPISMTTNRNPGKKIARVQLMVEGYNKFFTLNIDAENAWAVRAIPPHLSVKEKADTTEQRTGRFLLESIDKRPFRVLNVLDEKPRFVNFDPEKDEPRNRYFLEYDFTNLACDELPPFLIIRTDHPKARVLDIRVRHDPCTKITPRMPMGDFRSSLGVVQPGESVEVPLEFKKPRRPRMSSVTSKDPRLTTTMLEQTSDGKELKVLTLVTVSPDMPEGLFQIPITYSDGTIEADHIVYGWVEK